MALVIPANAGPTMNASPNAAPINPMTCERRSGGVPSAKDACATLTVAPVAPATMRDSIRRAKLSAQANRR